MNTSRSHIPHLASISAIAVTFLAAVFVLITPKVAVQSFAPPEVRDQSPSAISSTITHTYENPSHGCHATEMDVVKASGYPNLGKVWPKGLVLSGTIVQLVGTAEHQARSADCNTIFTAQPISWTVKYVNPKGHASDVTADLVDANTLTPTIKASEEGTYLVDLVYDGTPVITDSYVLQVIDSNSRLSWVNIGPDGTGTKSTGRVNAIAFDKFRPGVLYIGAANGGVWKSTDYGDTWTGMTNNKGWPTLVVGALAVATDGSAVYAGTGDPNFLWWKRGGTDGDAPRGGVGLYKSIDGGVTWTSANGSSGGGCTTIGGTLTRILIDPANASIVYVAGVNGVYRSTDAGACWKNIISTVSSAGTIYDIALKPDDSNTLYVAAQNYGLLKTSNVNAATPGWSYIYLLVTGNVRMAIGVSPDQPQIVYFDYIVDPDNNYYAQRSKRIQIVRSTSAGTGSWEALPLPAELANCTNSFQCDYNFALAVDPLDANSIYHGDVAVWRFDYPVSGSPSLSNWRDWSGPGACPRGGPCTANGQDIHADTHVLVFDPNIPGNLYSGNDGGFWKFDLFAPNRASWKSLNNGLAIGLFRTLAVRPIPGGPFDLAGGLQDNATEMRLGGSQWINVPYAAGDGWWASYDATAGSFTGIYFDQNAGFGGNIWNWRTTQFGIANQFSADPYRAGILIADSVSTSAPGTNTGGQLFYGFGATQISPPTWTCIDPTPTNLNDKVTAFTTARVFPSNNDRQYFVGLDSGKIYLVTVPQSPAIYPGCGGTAAGSAQILFTASYPTGTQITGLAEDPTRPCYLYVTAPNSVYSAERVFRLEGTPTATGCNMDTITGAVGMAATLPAELDGAFADSIHSHAIAVDPLSQTLTYIGTDRGMYVGQENTNLTTWTWTRVSSIPTATVTDIKAQLGSNGSDGTLYASTFGRGVYERLLTGGGSALKPIDLNNEITRCQVRHLHDPNTYWNTIDVEVDYSYNGAHGDFIRIRPVVTLNDDTAVNDFFIRETHGITIGQHTLNLQVIYGAQNAPPGLYTTGLRVEAYNDIGTPIFDANCDFAKTWRRDDARSLEVRALDLVEEGEAADTNAPVTVTLSSGLVITHEAPFTFVFTQGLTVTLQAPAYRMPADELRALHYWTLFGHSDSSQSPTFSFALLDDTAAIVRYISLDHRVYLPIILK
jgi:hypothetical protein